MELKKDSSELKIIEKDKQDLEEKLLSKNKECGEMETVVTNLKANLCKVEENNHVYVSHNYIFVIKKLKKVCQKFSCPTKSCNIETFSISFLTSISNLLIDFMLILY